MGILFWPIFGLLLSFSLLLVWLSARFDLRVSGLAFVAGILLLSVPVFWVTSGGAEELYVGLFCVASVATVVSVAVLPWLATSNFTSFAQRLFLAVAGPFVASYLSYYIFAFVCSVFFETHECVP